MDCLYYNIALSSGNEHDNFCLINHYGRIIGVGSDFLA